MPNTQNDFERALNSLYDAPLINEGWNTALKNVAWFVGKRNMAVLHAFDLANPAAEAYSLTSFVGYDGDWLYASEEKINAWMELDPWAAKITASNKKGALIGSDFADPNDVRKSAFWNDYWSKSSIGGVDIAGTVIPHNGSDNIFAVYSDTKSPVFDAEDRRSFHLIYPHIERAIQIQAKLSTLKNQLVASQSQLDTLAYGLLFLDRKQNITYANMKAESMLQCGNVVSAKNKHIHGQNQEENKAIQSSIKAALGLRCNGIRREIPLPKANVLKLYGQDEMRPWSMTIAPGSKQDEFEGLFLGAQAPHVIICISDMQPITDLRAQTIARTFSLTPQETLIASSLAAGDTLNSLAHSTGRSIETLRSHLKSIFDKTSTRSQTEVVRLVLTSPVAPS